MPARNPRSPSRKKALTMPDHILVAADRDTTLLRETLGDIRITLAPPVNTVDDLAKALGRDRFALILLDLVRPPAEETALLTALRERTPLPLIVLGGLGHEAAIRAFDAGADDFVPYPSHREELPARIRAAIRRSRMANHHLTLHDLSFDPTSMSATVAGQPLSLTPTEGKLLELLIRRRGQMIPSETILNQLYPHGEAREIKIVSVYVHSLRQKMKAAAQKKDAIACPVIETVWGQGYQLVDPAPVTP